MDVREVLQRARAEAGLDQRRLALAAGTARTTIVAYETGARSPTVRQLVRLLAACGLQARVLLEPLTTDVDRLLDEAQAAGLPAAFVHLPPLAAALTAAGVRWALDGVSAIAAQDLHVPHDVPAVVLMDGPATRAWLRACWAKAWDRHGFVAALSWYEDLAVVQGCLRRPVWTSFGLLQLRLVDPTDDPQAAALYVQPGDLLLPVLSLSAVRQAHPSLDDLLHRHEQRRRAA